MAAAAENAPYEKYAKHHTSVFSSLRNSIKRDADMFLFGEPTDKLVKLMIKIYHENILRILSTSRDKTMPDTGVGVKLKCMFGILQDETGDLYVTISEAPALVDVPHRDRPTDPDYLLKRAMMINILKSANVNVVYDEPDAIRLAAPILSDENRWRRGPDERYDTITERDAITRAINGNQNLKNVMIMDPEPTSKDIYHKRIRNGRPLEVKWIDSIEYLRRTGDRNTSFPPFKKYALKGNTWTAECNNGHLCTESKLFAYAALNRLTPVSFVAYWIGDGIPPENHIIRSYSYRTVAKPGNNIDEVRKETIKLQNVKQRCEQALFAPGLNAADVYPRALAQAPTFDAMLTSAVQPIAVACPGCYANIKAYIEGRMTSWDMSNCYVPRRHDPRVVGGKRRQTKRKQRKGRKTRKH